MRRLSVFADGWTLEAAEAVAGNPGVVEAGSRISAGEILDLLSRLIEKSMVMAEGQEDEARYRLLATIRSYSLEKLSESGEAESVSSRHAAYFLDLVEAAEPEMHGPHQLKWLNRLERDYDNILATLLLFQRRSDRESALRLTGALFWYWCLKGPYSDALEWSEPIIARARGMEPTGALAKASITNAFMHFMRQKLPLATARCRESLELFTKLGDRHGMAGALMWLGFWERNAGDLSAAEAHGEKSVRIFQELGDPWALAFSRMFYHAGPRDSVSESERREIETCAATFRLVGDSWGLAFALMLLGHLSRKAGNLVKAKSMLRRSEQLFREIGDRQLIAWVLRQLGQTYLEDSRLDDARECLEESLELFANLGNTIFACRTLRWLSRLEVSSGRHERAACLFASASALATSVTDPDAAVRMRYEPALTENLELGEVELAELWDRGCGMTLREAIDYARAKEL